MSCDEEDLARSFAMVNSMNEIKLYDDAMLADEDGLEASETLRPRGFVALCHTLLLRTKVCLLSSWR